MRDRKTTIIFDETPIETERAILRGLRYLKNEAAAMGLTGLAKVIQRVLNTYRRVTGGEL